MLSSLRARVRAVVLGRDARQVEIAGADVSGLAYGVVAGQAVRLRPERHRVHKLGDGNLRFNTSIT